MRSGPNGTSSGPSWQNPGLELNAPYLSCIGCKHLEFHDLHYPYCSAQDAPNKHVKPGEYAYPWKGAGRHIFWAKPDSKCPYPAPPVDASLYVQ
jgi:hypothetical protein